MAGRKPIPEEERFWEKVDKSGRNPDKPDCWEWTAHLVKGYGHFVCKRDGLNKSLGAHKYIWEKTNNKRVPKGLEVCHTCNNPPCVRPDHLEVGTRSHNQRYAVTHGNNKQSRKTHCINGHPFNEENTTFRPSRRTGLPSRHCKTCLKKYKKDGRLRKLRKQGIEPKKPNHCRNGHDLSVSPWRLGTKKSGNTYKICLECKRERERKRKKKNG
jgi:hypothetical protein